MVRCTRQSRSLSTLKLLSRPARYTLLLSEDILVMNEQKRTEDYFGTPLAHEETKSQ